MPKVSCDTSPKMQNRDEIIDLTKKTLHSKVEPQISLTAPPKPKRDWSSLNPDYVNVDMKQTERGVPDKNIKMKFAATAGRGTPGRTSVHTFSRGSKPIWDLQL